jgi:hypothetical protein
MQKQHAKLMYKTRKTYVQSTYKKGNDSVPALEFGLLRVIHAQGTYFAFLLESCTYFALPREYFALTPSKNCSFMLSSRSRQRWNLHHAHPYYDKLSQTRPNFVNDGSFSLYLQSSSQRFCGRCTFRRRNRITSSQSSQIRSCSAS